MAHTSNEWHLRDGEAVASVLDTDIYRGLSEREVKKRRRRDGENNIWHVKHESALTYAVSSVGDLTSVFLVISALTAAVFEKKGSALLICALLCIGLILRILTYVKARRTIERMADEGIPSATVIRDGRRIVIRSDELVVGDIVQLGAGDVVPCDGRIIAGDEIRISERGITENRDSVIKGKRVILTDDIGSEIPCELRVNMLFAGSLVLSGECRMIAVSCGNDTLVAAKHGGLSVPSGEKIPAIDKLSESCRRWNLAMLVCVFALVALSVVMNALRGNSIGFAEVFIDAMALAVSSAGSYLVHGGVASLGVSVIDAGNGSSAGAIIKDMSRLEKIASVEHIIVSNINELKTGRVKYSSYCKNMRTRNAEKNDSTSVQLFGFYALTHPASSVLQSAVGGGKVDSFFRRASDAVHCDLGIDVARETSKLGEVRDLSVTVTDRGNLHNAIFFAGGIYKYAVSGNVADILSMSDRYTTDSGEAPLSERARREILGEAKRSAGRGATVIAVAHRDSPYTTLKRTSTLQTSLCFEGFLTFDEEPCEMTCDGRRPKLIVMSDNPETDRLYLEHCGITEGASVIDCRSVLSGADLPDGDFIVSVPGPGAERRGTDMSRKVKLAVARKTEEALSGVAVMTADPAEGGMISDTAVGIAVCHSSSRPIPQTLKRCTCVSVYPGKSEKYSPLAGAISAVRSAARALLNMERAVCYAAIATCARVVIMLLSVLFSKQLITAPVLLSLGMISDFLAVLVISFARASGNSSRPLSHKISVSAGALGGGAIFAIVYICGLFPNIFGVLGEGAVCSMLLLLQPSLVALIISDSFVLNPAYMLNVVVSVFASAAAFFAPEIIGAAGGAYPSMAFLPIVMLPSAVLFVISAIRKNRAKKNPDSIHD